MKYITYATEKRINALKKRHTHNKKVFFIDMTMAEDLVVSIWNNIFDQNGHWCRTLKELEDHLGFRLDNKGRQESVENKQYFESIGIWGIEYMTDRNVRYVGTHDLHHVNIEDFNAFVAQVTEGKAKKHI